MKIIITGGAGFIASHLVDRLIDLGHQVLVIDDLSTGYKENINNKAEFENLDICDKKVQKVFKDFEPEIVFHLAAQKLIKVSMEQPELDAQINIVGSLNLLLAAKDVGVDKFIFVSTGGAIYDEHDGVPSNENSKAEPISPYALTKLTFEKYLEMLTKGSNMKWTSLRLANVYGPRQDPHGEGGVVAIFSESIIAGKDIFVNGDGMQTRDYIYVDDVVQALINSIDSEIGIYNVGTNQETSVLDIVESLKEISKKDFTVKHRDPIPGEVRRSALNCDKAHKQLNWQAKNNLMQGLKNTYKWFENQA